MFFNPFENPSSGGGGGGSGDKSRYTIEQIEESSGERKYKLKQTLNDGSPTYVGDIISFNGNSILVEYNGQPVILNTVIDNIEKFIENNYNFTTFTELDIDTQGKTLVQITNELIAKNLPTNTVVTGQLYSAALPFSGNGEAEVIVNSPAYWWKCGSLNVAPYSWTAITASSSWGDNGLVMDWTPTTNIPEIAISSSQPTDGEILWINPSDTVTQYIPEVKDSLINQNDTWSSQKINHELNDIMTMFNPMTQQEYDELVDKTRPVYFVYEP